ncbi:uncharacterized protein [Penaeus vannamei]|uniref:uncharacterized protein n=1 Tax=Penaeus vannamei TaxID=6689 RepID=UPI00387F71BB
MACSLRNIINFGLLLAVVDLLHGVATCAFYGYQFSIHYRCHWAHGLRWCQHYLYMSDHSVRVNIGIAEGVGCLFFSTILIIGLCKRKPLVTWTWLLKPIAVVIINVFFLSRWLAQKSRYYHSFLDRRSDEQENLFTYLGLGLTLVQVFVMLFLLCINGSFTYKIRKQGAPNTDRAECVI